MPLGTFRISFKKITKALNLSPNFSRTAALGRAEGGEVPEDQVPCAPGQPMQAGHLLKSLYDGPQEAQLGQQEGRGLYQHTSSSSLQWYHVCPLK